MQGYPIPGFKENTHLVRSLRGYATESLDRYKRLVEADPDKPFPTLFTRLFKGEEDESLTFKEIVDEAQTYIIAGTDTTAITLTYTVWRVCQNLRIQQKLVEELRQLPEDFGDHEAQKMPYLNQVIEEALRLHSAAPSGLPRVVPPEGATLAGQYLPPGSVVCTQAWSLHRNTDIFPDPERFDPDRWASPTKNMKDASMPFGGGSRSKTDTPTLFPFQFLLLPMYSRSHANDNSRCLCSLPWASPRSHGAQAGYRPFLPQVPERQDVCAGGHVR